MKIKVTKGESQALDAFYKKEWEAIDRKHYGQEVRWESWRPKNFTVEVWNDNEITGALSFLIIQDVTQIVLFITAENHRGEGVGRKLLDKMEEVSKANGVHKIYLQTGRDWEAVSFYKSNGYKETGSLPNHYLHADYIELTKFV